MASSPGSATGNPRNKVALKQGHSLMDWIRLGNSGADLSGTGGAILQVTKEELTRHKSVGDAWICLRGNVYNITRYLDFHPGGGNELMKGAGIDATSLFNRVHSWVNYESILKKCLVGQLVSGVDSDIFASPNESPFKNVLQIPQQSAQKLQSPNNDIKFDWTQQRKFVTFYIYLKESIEQVFVTNIPENELWLLVNGSWMGWSLVAAVNWPPTVVMTTSDLKKMEIKLDKPDDKAGPIMWQKIPYPLPVQEMEPPAAFFQLEVGSVTQITYNVFTINLQYRKRVFHYIPIGHHIVLKAKMKGLTVQRSYTPISNLLGQENFPNGVTLMVKSYPDGMFSSWITSRKANEVVDASLVPGTFSVANIRDYKNLILIAAGTGFTPMVRLINWVLQSHKKIKVKLLFFNRTEKDIIWKEELSHLMSKNNRFSVEHILSEAGPSWKGTRGCVTLQFLQSVLPDFTGVLLPWQYYICICGPISFSQLTERYLTDMHYTTEHYFCFRG